jgi:acetyl-CoA acetyltransferase
MAPAVTIPKILERNSLMLDDIDLVEIHEAFGAQVLANIRALEDGFKGQPTGPFRMDRVNVSGSSLAIGHPWSATGGRIITTLANEMARRDVRLGLVSICAAGAMAGAVLLERN